MEKQFVTYEIATKLKELGFNEECLAGFRTTLGNNIPELIFGKFNYNSNKYVEIPEESYVDAPLWQQAIVFCLLRYEEYKRIFFPSIRILSDGSGEIIGDDITDGILFDTLEECILEFTEFLFLHE